MKSEAHPCHYGDKKKEEALPVAVHILFGKFDADSEHANSDDDASELEGNSISAFVTVIPPRTGIKDVCSIWA